LLLTIELLIDATVRFTRIPPPWFSAMLPETTDWTIENPALVDE
jgi:hypothetical protein